MLIAAINEISVLYMNENALDAGDVTKKKSVPAIIPIRSDPKKRYETDFDTNYSMYSTYMAGLVQLCFVEI